MNEVELKQSVAYLDELSFKEYKQSINEVLAQDSQSIDRIGRLIGVILKEPLATVSEFDKSDNDMKAYRKWELKPESEWDKSITDTWQYKALDGIKNSDTRLEGQSLYGVAQYLHYELGFYRAFKRSIGGYLCGNTKLKQQIDNALNQAHLPAVGSPEWFSGIGVLLSSILAPVVGAVSAPVVAALVIIIYKIGIDAFCSLGNDENSENY